MTHLTLSIILTNTLCCYIVEELLNILLLCCCVGVGYIVVDFILQCHLITSLIQWLLLLVPPMAIITVHSLKRNAITRKEVMLLKKICRKCKRLIIYLLYSTKLWWGNFGEFGELNFICQYFTQPNLSPFFVKLSTSR